MEAPAKWQRIGVAIWHKSDINASAIRSVYDSRTKHSVVAQNLRKQFLYK